MAISNTELEAATHTEHDSSVSCSTGRSATTVNRASSPVLFHSQLSRKYWATRFYNFLSTLPELATAIKDDVSLANL